MLAASTVRVGEGDVGPAVVVVVTAVVVVAAIACPGVVVTGREMAVPVIMSGSWGVKVAVAGAGVPGMAVNAWGAVVVIVPWVPVVAAAVGVAGVWAPAVTSDSAASNSITPPSP